MKPADTKTPIESLQHIANLLALPGYLQSCMTEDPTVSQEFKNLTKECCYAALDLEFPTDTKAAISRMASAQKDMVELSLRYIGQNLESILEIFTAITFDGLMVEHDDADLPDQVRAQMDELEKRVGSRPRCGNPIKPLAEIYEACSFMLGGEKALNEAQVRASQSVPKSARASHEVNMAFQVSDLILQALARHTQDPAVAVYSMFGVRESVQLLTKTVCSPTILGGVDAGDIYASLAAMSVESIQGAEARNNAAQAVAGFAIERAAETSKRPNSPFNPTIVH